MATVAVIFAAAVGLCTFINRFLSNGQDRGKPRGIWAAKAKRFVEAVPKKQSVLASIQAGVIEQCGTEMRLNVPSGIASVLVIPCQS
jgi:hypothetical protein